MSVPPAVLARMMQSGGQQATPPVNASAPATGAPPGMGSPMAGPPGQQPSGSPTPQVQQKKGLRLAAMSNLKIAQNMIEQALTAFEPGDPEYRAALACLNKLASVAGKNGGGSDLVPAQVLRMVQQLPQVGGGSDMQRQIMQQLHQPQQPPSGAQPPAGGAGAAG